jgi:S1-C subfamily serine protease
MTLLDELTSTIRSAHAAAGPSVVSIGRSGRGSGVVIGAGQILTNAHNLRDRTTQVTFADGRSLQATAAGLDLAGDLALLSVDTGGVAPLTWSPTAAGTGDVVLALGRNRRGLHVSFGTVSAVEVTFTGPRGRRIAGALEHTAPLARGSSGGPLLDRDGRVVAINTSRLGDGFTLARPGDAELQQRIARLAAGEVIPGVRLGVAIVPPPVAAKLRRSVGLPERDGLLVRGVEDASPAAAAGIGQGDLIVAADGVAVAGIDDLHRVLDSLATDRTEFVVRVARGTDQIDLTVPLGG